MNEYKNVSLKYVVEAGKAYRSSKKTLQTALGGVVYQVTQGNANWINNFFRSAGFLEFKVGAMVISADGKTMWHYMREALGLDSVIGFNTKENVFKFKKGWKAKVEELDLNKLEFTLKTVRWDMFQSEKAETFFDPKKATVNYLKTMFSDKKGKMKNMDQVQSFINKVHREMLQEQIAA